jgi:FkbM family methyltransferase
MNSLEFTYNHNVYQFRYYDFDHSGLGCIREIVSQNEYLLDQFVNNKNKYFIDIGANCGVATIILAKQNPESIVLSFEPDQQVFKLLEENVKVNHLTNVKVFNLAVTKKEITSLKLYIHPHYSGGNSTYAGLDAINQFFNKNIDFYEVNTTYLDKIIADNNISEVELLKIDCEGAEYDILYNSEFMRTNNIKNMVGEFHNLQYNTLVNSNYNDLLNYCEEYVKGILKITKLDL